MSERWKLGWLESYNAYTGEPERFVYRPGDDEHTRICVRGENCDEDARRIVASVNACLGIPTETLEAGVVVVPAEVAAVLADEVRRITESLREFCGVQRDEATPGWLAHWEKRVQAWATLADALSRLQQNGTSSNPANMPVLKLMADAEKRQRETSRRFLSRLGFNGGEGR